MPRCIHFNGKEFAVWSSIVDAYVTYTMTERECVEHLLREGDTAPNQIPLRIARAKENGCSIIPKQIRCDNIDFTSIKEPT